MKDIGEDASPSRSPSWCSATFRDQVMWKLRSAHRSSSDQNHEVENKEIRPEDPGSGERCKHIAKVKWQHSMVDQCIESHLELTISNLPLDATETWIRQMFNTIGIFPSTIKMIERPSDSYIPFKPLAAVTFERQSEMVDCFLRAHLIKYFENSLSHSLHAHRHKSNETRKYLVQSGQEDKEGAALSKNEDSDEEKCQTDEEEEGGIPAAHQMDLSSRVEAMFNITGNSYKQEEQVVEVQEKKMNRDQKQRLVDLCMSEFTPKVQSGTVKGVLQTILVELAQSRLHDVVEVRKSEILMRKRNARTPTNATVDDEDYDLGNDVTTDRVGAEMEHIKSTECTTAKKLERNSEINDGVLHRSETSLSEPPLKVAKIHLDGALAHKPERGVKLEIVPQISYVCHALRNIAPLARGNIRRYGGGLVSNESETSIDRYKTRHVDMKVAKWARDVLTYWIRCPGLPSEPPITKLPVLSLRTKPPRRVVIEDSDEDNEECSAVVSIDTKQEFRYMQAAMNCLFVEHQQVNVHPSHAVGLDFFSKIQFIEPKSHDGYDEIDNGIKELKKTSDEETSLSCVRLERESSRFSASRLFESELADVSKYYDLKNKPWRLELGRSRIHGWGLFTSEEIGKEEIVIEYMGEQIRESVANVRETEYEKRGIGHSYMFRVLGDIIIDATVKGNLARFINHSCQPNCYARIANLNGEKKILIISKQKLFPGEEITYDYNFNAENVKLPCACGAKGCRKTLT